MNAKELAVIVYGLATYAAVALLAAMTGATGALGLLTVALGFTYVFQVLALAAAPGLTLLILRATVVALACSAAVLAYNGV